MDSEESCPTAWRDQVWGMRGLRRGCHLAFASSQPLEPWGFDRMLTGFGDGNMGLLPKTDAS